MVKKKGVKAEQQTNISTAMASGLDMLKTVQAQPWMPASAQP